MWPNSVPAVADGVVYVGASSDGVAAIEAFTAGSGARRWSTSFPAGGHARHYASPDPGVRTWTQFLDFDEETQHRALQYLRERGRTGSPEPFGMVVSFTLDSAERAQRFIGSCELVIEATSFGGVHTTAERRARWAQGDDVAPGFVRLSAGIEDAEDLLADIGAALDASV